MSNFVNKCDTMNSDSCRVCFDKDFVGGTDLSKDENMFKLFEFCIGISININCPTTKLCLKCGETIENYVKFKELCLESEVRWKLFEEDLMETDSTNFIQQSELKIKKELIKYEQFENEQIFDNENNNKDSSHTMSYDSVKLIQNYTNDDEVNSESIIETTNYDINCINGKITKIYQCEKCKKEYSKQKWLITHKMNVCFKDLYKNIVNSTKYGKDNMNKEAKELEESDAKNVSDTLSGCGDVSSVVPRQGNQNLMTDSQNNRAELSKIVGTSAFTSPTSNLRCLCSTTYSCDIATHMDEHWTNNDLQCQLCNYCGRDFADMITHSFQHNPKKKLVCHACKKKKASILSLQFHFRSVHLQKTGGICSICSKTFKKFKTWKRHERLHNENSLFICDHCGRKFLYKHEIRSHLIYHTDVRLFVCETCGKGFKRMSGLKDHIENLHRIRQPVKCDHCDKTYKSQSKLEIHLRNVAKDKPFVCEVCSKRFISEKVLQKHMFWHTGERPHRCEVCGSRYKAKGQLNIHMRNHTGFMPHKCVDCGKSFPAAKQLKRHQSVHTGVRAYKCDYCERSFHEKKTMLEHATQHKSTENVKPEN